MQTGWKKTKRTRMQRIDTETKNTKLYHFCLQSAIDTQFRGDAFVSLLFHWKLTNRKCFCCSSFLFAFVCCFFAGLAVLIFVCYLYRYDVILYLFYAFFFQRVVISAKMEHTHTRHSFYLAPLFSWVDQPREIKKTTTHFDIKLIYDENWSIQQQKH